MPVPLKEETRLIDGRNLNVDGCSWVQVVLAVISHTSKTRDRLPPAPLKPRRGPRGAGENV